MFGAQLKIGDQCTKQGPEVGRHFMHRVLKHPLYRLSRKHKDKHHQSLGKHLKTQADAVDILNIDCRHGLNASTMAVNGTRSYNQELIPYSNTPDGTYGELEKCSCRYFSKYGFDRQINKIRNTLIGTGVNKETVTGSQTVYPWNTIYVMTVNYGNE